MFGPAAAINHAAWKAQKAALRAQKAAFRAERRHHHTFLGRVFGLFWGAFWILFGLSLAFGGDSYRREVFDFIQSIGRWAADFFRSLMTGTSIQ